MTSSPLSQSLKLVSQCAFIVFTPLNLLIVLMLRA
jgi:hypothetical protein